MNVLDVNFFQSKRWFKGKTSNIQEVSLKDSFSVGNCQFSLLSVRFENGDIDFYGVLNSEECVGEFLSSLFDFEGKEGLFSGTSGQFKVLRYEDFSSKALKDLELLEGEQSNSSFLSPGKYFFKLFRRLSSGIHPEEEILASFRNSGFNYAPKLLGSFSYIEGNSTYVLGLLESAVEHSVSAWDFFKGDFTEMSAALIGQRTAQMHQALKNIPGSPLENPEVPFEKLKSLLEKSLEIPYAQELLKKVPELQKKYLELKRENSNIPVQRIHGDYHLGQILYGRENLWIVDFEGEPSRPLAYRRSLQPITVDLAGMLRSFRYAKVVFSKETQRAEEIFLESYGEQAGIPFKHLENACKPYYLAKAVYEACYELEFRPDWFSVPAKGLLEEFQ